MKYLICYLLGAGPPAALLLAYYLGVKRERKPTELEQRFDELYRFSDWLTVNDPLNHLTYSHERGVELDEQRGDV